MTAFDHGTAFSVFADAVECLNRRFKGRFFIVDGTLLGYARCGGFVPGDYDIDFGMWIEDYDLSIIDDFKSAGFNLRYSLGAPETGFQLKFTKKGISVDLPFYYRENGKIWNLVFPKYAVYKAVYPEFGLEKAEFNGLEIMVPSLPAVYLEAAYGPRWRRPVRRWNYKYMTHNLESQNSKFIDALYWLKGKYWHWRNPDVYANADGQRDRIVFVDGVFDLFHANHSLFLKEARARGSLLVAAVISDRNATSYKRVPAIPEQERLQIVQSHKSVDIAFIYDEDFTAANLAKIIADYEIDEVVCAGASTGIWADYYSPAIEGGFFTKLPYHAGRNTSQTIAMLRSAS